MSKEELVQKVVEILSSVDLNRTENLDGSEELPRIEDVCDIMMKKDPEVFEQVIQNPDIFRSAYERVLSVMADHDDHLDEIDEMYDDGADPDADIEGHLNEFLGGDDNMDITESAADIVANAELTARDEENIQSVIVFILRFFSGDDTMKIIIRRVCTRGYSQLFFCLVDYSF